MSRKNKKFFGTRLAARKSACPFKNASFRKNEDFSIDYATKFDKKRNQSFANLRRRKSNDDEF